ncbi:hypothetical protein Vadar_020966 [Vaccinium darrowii]|uniref:Uncharacterized protein n=1 Tax=Vaccinium darrowii TaxID=229202 RepID=A0ACB7YNZ5_9ERIC|nr:hypothetical protein Vadar_020966 [Vaccinium darrowii]
MWRKVPKSVMEKLKPWDRNELQRREEQLRLKCESKLEAVDWDMMKKHLTPEDRKAYERLCTEVRSDIIKNLTELLHTRRPSRYLQYYYGEFGYLPFKERMGLTWTRWKEMCHGTFSASKIASKILEIGSVGLAGVLFGLSLAGNEKGKES